MEAKTIGSKIAKARKETNMSQAQLAQQLFISPQAVGKWERGESLPDIITINRLAEILGVDLNYFSENFESTKADVALAAPVTGSDYTEPTMPVEAAPSGKEERALITDFTGTDLSGTDFAGVMAPKRKFNASNLRGSNFTGADLTGCSFVTCDASEARFDEANLTDCTLSIVNLTDASFSRSILVRTTFSKSELIRATFTDVKLIDVKLDIADLRTTVFKNCVFSGVDFRRSDLRGQCFDGQTFIGVRFDRATLNEAMFKGATFKNVSFRPAFALTNKYYRAIGTINFEGATMDKLTYAALKGMGARLGTVTIL
ncbi:helix-turn-helix domain-containing protein [Chitinophaga sp. G-6-1-13]|uniref:Helix-turn-helix domain-containing protein n=1 Tax=Chitinophaga fulva TaxID=2728842 RepID=A0A848GTH0_9BACT|nr:pentapeptide repeat-containing protein [Chitinophaga fulva]NML40033.1 helix-turn-helix domain-containing protein [Chitinophaga fulva]